MAANQPPWPREWLMTDERIGDRLWEAIEALPKGAGVVFRHYATADEERAALAQRVAAACRNRGLTFAVAGGRALANAVGAALVHNPDRGGDLPLSLAVHDEAEARTARESGAALVFIAPIFPTHSHAGAPVLGLEKAADLAGMAGCLAIGLGGMNAERFRDLESAHPGAFHGYAGIDCWLEKLLRT
jgi:thiamine-phosphate pyrophosphorylase